MFWYVIKRVLLLIPVIIAVSFLVFILIDLSPGSPIDAILGGDSTLTDDDIQALREQFNLHRSVFYRYWLYMVNLLQGDLGVSMHTGIDVWSLYISRLPYTLALSAGALVIGAGVSIPMGIRAAKRAGKLTDTVTTTFTLFGMSMPGFWLGLLMMMLFSHRLGWLPATGSQHGLRSFIMPAVCCSMMLMALSARQTRSSMLEVLGADFLRTARSKGVPERAVIRRHALGNAWIPIVTTIGTSLSAVLAGSAVIEAVFSWPGVGRMIIDAVGARDVTTLTGAVIMTTIIYVLLQLFVDLSYAFIDPRIRAQYLSSGKFKKRSPVADMPSDQQPSPGLPQPEDTQMIDSSRVQAKMPSDANQAQLEKQSAIVQAHPDVALQMQHATLRTQDARLLHGQGVTEQVQGAPQTQPMHSAATPKSDEEVMRIIRKHRKRGRFGEIFHSMKRSKSAMAGLIIFCALLIVLIASLFVSFDAVTEPDLMVRFRPPGREFFFGTDGLGRDQFVRIVYGTRYSLGIGFTAAAIATFFGVLLGSIASYFGKITDEVIMRFSDILASIPAMLLGMVIVTMLGPSVRNLIIAVATPGIPVFIRITRASILSVKGNEFVEAARAVGFNSLRILYTQVLPNGLAPIIVTFTTSLGITIIMAASLSFLGFGVPIPHPEWGALISGGRQFIRHAPWLTTYPGMFIMVTVLAFNLLGDGLRDALDPKQKR